MNEINKVRAALLVLNQPLAAEIPPREVYPRGLMQPDLNPEFEDWAQGLIERLRALCVVNGIEPTASGGIDWPRLAVRLVFDYEPRDKREPRIKIKRKRGAKSKHDKPAAEAARRELAEIVVRKRASNPRLSVSKIAGDLAGKDKKLLPAAFAHMSAETLRKQIERAQKETARDRIRELTLSEILGLNLQTPPNSGTGRGLQWRPNKKPG
jgi:hypothetical protein